MKEKSNILYMAFVITAILVLSYKWYNSPLRNTQRIQVDDGNVYFVQEDYPDKKKAAKMMSLLNNKVMDVLKFLKQRNESGQYNDSPYLKGVVERMLKNWNPERLYESPPDAPGTSYTIAKGQKTVFCLRSKNDEKLHELDDMLFVVLHELSHMGDLNWGHKQSFWEVFKFVLNEAKEGGFYEPVNYRESPIKYCGLSVNYNPYFDPSISKLWE